jgi:hypothetical protein
MKPYFGLKGPWLTIWITVCCGTAMTLFGYDQGVFSKSLRLHLSPSPHTSVNLGWKASC